MRNGPLAALVFLIVFTVYFVFSPVVTVYDSIWFVPISLSIIREGNTDLDEYATNVEACAYYGVIKPGEHLQSYFPVGSSVLAVPLVLVADKLASRLWHVDLREHYARVTMDPLTWRIEHCIASIIAALAAVVMYLIARRYLSPPKSLLVVVIFAFGTSLWSTASRALWQHGPSILMLSVALYLLLRAEDNPKLAQFISIPLAFAYIIRPTNSLSIVAFTVLVALTHRRWLPMYFLWAGLIAVPFLLFNRATYGALLPPYYLAGRIVGSPTFGIALLGNLISPGRGLLVYSPVFLLVGYGVVLKLRKRTLTAIDAGLCCIVLAHWLVISSFPVWYGGWSYGPRFFSDVVPYLTFLLIPVITELCRPVRASEALRTASFVCLAAISFFTHGRGAIDPATVAWNPANAVVADVDLAPERLWDWHDPQFWRGLRPGALTVVPDAFAVTVSEFVQSPARADLTLLNPGDKPVQVSVELPARITTAFGVALEAFWLAPQGKLDLPLDVNSAGYGPGKHSLGGVRVERLDQEGAAGMIVVPFGVHVLGPNVAEAGPTVFDRRIYLPLIEATVMGMGTTTVMAMDKASFMPPGDILVNGAQQNPDPSKLRAIFGRGWFDPETADHAEWRWATSPAVVLVYTADNRAVTLNSTLVAAYDPGSPTRKGERAALSLRVKGGKRADFEAAVGARFSVEVSLKPGWNVLVLENKTGNFRPVDVEPGSGDARSLSFALGPIDLRER